MHTVGRDVKSKEDRYGAFERGEVSSRRDSYGEILKAKDYTDAGRSFGSSVDVRPKVDVTETSGFGGITNVGISPKKQGLVVSNEYAIGASNARAGNAKKDKITSKGLVMMISYSLVVVAMVAMIILNSSALSVLGTKNASLSDRLTSLTTSQTSLNSTLSTLNDPTRLSNLATDSLNMTTTSATVVEMALPNYVPVTEKVINNNWFDKICDGISNLVSPS